MHNIFHVLQLRKCLDEEHKVGNLSKVDLKFKLEVQKATSGDS